MLESALAAGIAAAGGDALLGGVLPTPGRGDPGPAPRARPRRGRLRLPQPLPRQRDQVLLRRTGRKLDDEAEARIEALLERAAARPREPGRVRELERRPRGLPARARGGLPARPLRPHGRRSTAPTAPPTAPPRRSSSGSAPRSRRSAVEPDGRNINDGCGSTHLERARRARRRLRGRDRLRLRRRRRPRARGRRRRPRPRRRRADRPRRPRHGRRAASSAAASPSP